MCINVDSVRIGITVMIVAIGHGTDLAVTQCAREAHMADLEEISNACAIRDRAHA
jgi:hypothetical protein